MDILMVYPNNIQSSFNGYISQIRNMFNTSSISLAMVAFSFHFKPFGLYIKIIAVAVILYSMLYGYISSKNFSNYLNYIEANNELSDLNKLQFAQWRTSILFGYVYVIILIVLAILIIFKTNNRFKK